MFTWTRQKPSKPGWYWMLNQKEDCGLPTVVQIVFDWETRRSVTLVPASKDPKVPGLVLDLHNVDALWAGPIELPSVFEKRNTA